jgi:ADP-ribose pyrophosphatase YjhB (NUDIX family)
MQEGQLHSVQLTILSTLRHTHSARFSELQKQSELDSDVFKFHIKALQKRGFVEKALDGTYGLTAAGKLFANNLDDSTRAPQKQPKLSVLLLIQRQNERGETAFLLQQRLRHPYWGFIGLMTGPVLWGTSIEDAAKQELKKQTGLSGAPRLRSFIRQTDYIQNSESLLEDKLFALVEIGDVSGELSNSWRGGHNEWLTLEQLKTENKVFTATLQTLSRLSELEPYSSYQAFYSNDDY